jgi:hypothetical protein
MKRQNDIEQDFFSNKRCKLFVYEFALERAQSIVNDLNEVNEVNEVNKVNNLPSLAPLKLFLNSLSDTFMKIEIDSSIGLRSFNFTINGKLFSTATSKEIYLYDFHDSDFYNFVKKLSEILVDPVTEYCDELGLILIDDPHNIISPSYYTAHFLACLRGYKFI